MGNERNSKCWYKDVCTQECTGCIRYSEMNYLFTNSGIPANKRYPEELSAGVDYDEYIHLANIKSNIYSWVQSGKNLYIGSRNTGNGKTTWSIKLLLKYFDSIWAGNGFRVAGMFVHVPTLLLQMKNFNAPLSEEYKRNLVECDLVVWDDIACGNVSQYDFTNLMMLIDSRTANGRSNIYTSNQDTKQKLEAVVGDRLASRIWELSDVIVFNGKDKRHGSITNYQ